MKFRLTIGRHSQLVFECQADDEANCHGLGFGLAEVAEILHRSFRFVKMMDRANLRQHMIEVFPYHAAEIDQMMAVEAEQAFARMG